MTVQLSTALRTAQASAIQTNLIATTRGAWTASTAYALNDTVLNGGNTYRATVAGTSAASGGPTGTTTAITDNTVTWTYAPSSIKFFSGAEPANCAAADPTGLLGSFNLPETALTSASGVASLAGTWSGAMTTNGTASTFRIYDPSGTNCVMQGVVGWQSTGAWAASTAYALNAIENNGGNVYQVTVAGTSAASGGPTGTGATITDNTVTWKYLGPVGDMQLGNPVFANAPVVQVNTFTVTLAGA